MRSPLPTNMIARPRNVLNKEGNLFKVNSTFSKKSQCSVSSMRLCNFVSSLQSVGKTATKISHFVRPKKSHSDARESCRTRLFDQSFSHDSTAKCDDDRTVETAGASKCSYNMSTVVVDTNNDVHSYLNECNLSKKAVKENKKRQSADGSNSKHFRKLQREASDVTIFTNEFIFDSDEFAINSNSILFEFLHSFDDRTEEKRRQSGSVLNSDCCRREDFRNASEDKFSLLQQAFLLALRKYAASLHQMLPTPTSINCQETKSYSLSSREEILVCKIVQVAHHFCIRLESLSAAMRDKRNPQHKHEMDMSNEQKAFHDVANRAVDILVSGFKIQTNSAFTEMSKTDWGRAIIDASEESTYVRSMNTTIKSFCENVQCYLPPLYFRLLCRKLASAFLSKYFDTLMSQDKLSRSATEQLLLDIYSLKEVLIKIPAMKKDSNHQDVAFYSMYIRTVMNGFARIEKLLHLVGTPSKLLVDVYRRNCPNGTAVGFRRIMDLKGVNRSQQCRMVRALGLD